MPPHTYVPNGGSTSQHIGVPHASCICPTSYAQDAPPITSLLRHPSLLAFSKPRLPFAPHTRLHLPRPPDTFIQKTKKLYLDTRTQRNLSKLNDDLAEVHSIMTRNIQEVLGQGEKLDSEWGQGGGRASCCMSHAGPQGSCCMGGLGRKGVLVGVPAKGVAAEGVSARLPVAGQLRSAGSDH